MWPVRGHKTWLCYNRVTVSPHGGNLPASRYGGLSRGKGGAGVSALPYFDPEAFAAASWN